MIKIPFSFIPPKQLQGMSRIFLGLSDFLSKWFPFLGVNLRQAKIDVEPREYLSMCLFSSIFFYVLSSFIIIILLKSLAVENYLLRAPFIAFIFFVFVFLQQIMYPRLVTKT